MPRPRRCEAIVEQSRARSAVFDVITNGVPVEIAVAVRESVMRQVEAVVIGAGQAGLALSRCLIDRGVGHVVLERGRVGERWRSERWDSLRLLSPNWQTRLPHFSYDGSRSGRLHDRPARWSTSWRATPTRFAAPVEELTVGRARLAGASAASWSRPAEALWMAPVVAIATGYCDTPAVPAWANRIPAALHQITPSTYRSPAHLPDGGVLVVGASATGVQLAHELRRDGRVRSFSPSAGTFGCRGPTAVATSCGGSIEWACSTTRLAVGRRSRGGAQRSPRSSSWAARIMRRSALPICRTSASRSSGRLVGIDGPIGKTSTTAWSRTTVAADAKLATVLQRIDAFADAHGLNDVGERLDGFAPIWPRFVEASRRPIDLEQRST